MNKYHYLSEYQNTHNKSSRFYDKEIIPFILNYDETQFINPWKKFDEVIHYQN